MSKLQVASGGAVSKLKVEPGEVRNPPEINR